MGKWLSQIRTCDFCKTDLAREDVFIDGRTIYGGMWALMCVKCHAAFGVGLGTGKGQKYAVDTKEKIAG